MCLESVRTKEPLIATQDIVCYKYIYKIKKWIFPTYITPFRGVTVWKRKYKSKLERFGSSTNGYVERGLHSFAKYKDAYHYAESSWGAVVVQCIIPKGSRYYEGKFNGDAAYASDTLIYKKFNYKP